MKLWRSINKYSGRLVLNPISPKATTPKQKGSKPSGRSDRRQERFDRLSMTWAVWPVSLAVRPAVTRTVEQSEKQPVIKTQIDLTFDSHGQNLPKLRHTFSKILGTYSNQEFQRSNPKTLSFLDWTKVVQERCKNENVIQTLARGWLMIKMILDMFPHVTAS